MTPAKKLVLFFGASAATALLIAALNFVVDPLQLFRTARFFPAMYSSNDRLQAAGILQSQDFDAVFMGTSLGVHYRASEISKRLDARVVKIAMSGATSAEQSFVLHAALQKSPKPKLVVWEMDDWIFRNALDVDAYLPTDIYRRNLKGMAGYLLSMNTMKESLGIAASQFKLLGGITRQLTWLQVLQFHNENVDDLNTVPNYLDLATLYNSSKALASFAHYRAQPAALGAGYDYDAMVRNFERNALALIAANPEVRFKIFFPPYSILHFVAMREGTPAALRVFYDFSGYMHRRLSKFQNVEAFDFRDVYEITHCLNNYADLVHHSPVVDRKILSFLQTGQHRVDPSDPEASLRRLRVDVQSYHAPWGFDQL
jgi:hypothetical protein